MPSSWNHRWPLERILFALAGTVTLTSALLAATVSPWFLLLTAFVGVNQWLYVTVGACPRVAPPATSLRPTHLPGRTIRRHDLPHPTGELAADARQPFR